MPRLLAIASALTLAFTSGAQAQTVIHVGHLIAEPGQPVRDRQSIIIEQGRIAAVKDGFVKGDRVIDLSNDWVLPGLIDMHTHVSITMDIDAPDPATDMLPAVLGRPARRVLATIPRAQAVLHNGFTTIRNLGDPASVTYDLRNAIDAGIVTGPRIIADEPMFGVAGGDYDASAFGERADLEPLFRSRGTCSGPVDCVRAVREEVHRGADVIKLRLAAQTSADPKSEPMETPEEIQAIVSTAHRLNRKVAVHSAGSGAANQIAIDAGADTIEHGPLTDQNIAGMVAHRTAYTATLMAAKLAEGKLGVEGGYYDQVAASVRKAYRAGVPILFGSDLPVVPAARTAEEFALLGAAGLTPADALKAATINAARALGMDDTIGSIAPGKAADIIAVGHDPLRDLNQMTKVTFVMKGGEVIRDDAAAKPARR